MKKVIISILFVLLCICFLCSCGYKEVEKESNEDENSVFVLVEDAPSWRVVYHKYTKVMYAVSSGYYNSGTFTLLVNEDGTPMIYGEDY